jgi:murein DD-endopeptidase MepM/ murein hydrolase activator NlpD
LDKDAHRDWGMMQGFLTLPFTPDTVIRVMTYEDLDDSRGEVRDWNGTTTVRSDLKGGPGSVYDNHKGIDYGYGESGDVCKMKVYAGAPGRIVTSRPAGGKGGVIMVLHTGGFITEYGHLDESFVSEGQDVSRGALLGTTSCGWAIPHLHYALYDEAKHWLPIFRDPLASTAVSYWTKDNSPQFAAGYR